MNVVGKPEDKIMNAVKPSGRVSMGQGVLLYILLLYVLFSHTRSIGPFTILLNGIRVLVSQLIPSVLIIHHGL